MKVYYLKLKPLIEEFSKEHCLLNNISIDKKTIKKDIQDLKDIDTCKKRFWPYYQYEDKSDEYMKYKSLYPLMKFFLLNYHE